MCLRRQLARPFTVLLDVTAVVLTGKVVDKLPAGTITGEAICTKVWAQVTWTEKPPAGAALVR